MTQIILIIIGIAIVVILLSRKSREKVVGICAAAIGVDAKKQENKEKILELLKKNPSTPHQSSTGSDGTGRASSGNKELSNSDIREALGVSDRTAIRYMDELEKEGKVKQEGNTGRSVTYRLKH